jgi:phosphatidylserine/phosphatidylglycerophosphate/cardiolipin synthase-like enzyme
MHRGREEGAAVISLNTATTKSFKLFLLFRISPIALYCVLLFFSSGAVSASGTFPARVTLLKNSEYPVALLESIRNSQKTVFLSYYLFKISPSASSLPDKIAVELIKAANRGVAVTVILEISNDPDDQLNGENRQTASLLTRNGIRVLFDSPRRRSHLKTALIDDRYVFIGSHNLTQSALKYNNEISVLIDSPEIASEMKAYLKALPAKQKGAGPESFSGVTP